MYTGQIILMDADNAFTGDIASLDFDFRFTGLPNEHKSKDTHPDYHLEARSPRGRPVRVGSAWEATSRAGNKYMQLAITLPGHGQIRVNAVKDDQGEPGIFRIIPMAMAEAA